MARPTFDYEYALHQIDYSLAVADNTLIEEMVSIIEASEGDQVYTEAKRATLGEALRIFLASIIAGFERLKDAISTEVQQKLFSEEYKKHIEKLKEDVLTAEIRHARTVKMVDFRAATALYEQMVVELLKKAQRISDVKYLTAKGLDKDIEEFYVIADSYDRKLEDIFSNEKEFPIQEVIRFIDREAEGGPILQSLDRSMRAFKEMEHDVKAIERKEAIIGKELITKKVSIVRRSSNKVFAAIKKWITMLIGKCVFYFA